MTFERGPLIPYEVIWRSGHVEVIKAHQVLWPPSSAFVFGPAQRDTRVLFHGEVDGRWQLLLAVDEADLTSVRRLSQETASGERVE